MGMLSIHITTNHVARVGGGDLCVRVFARTYLNDFLSDQEGPMALIESSSHGRVSSREVVGSEDGSGKWASIVCMEGSSLYEPAEVKCPPPPSFPALRSLNSQWVPSRVLLRRGPSLIARADKTAGTGALSGAKSRRAARVLPFSLALQAFSLLSLSSPTAVCQGTRQPL